jgi:hypothetical protein
VSYRALFETKIIRTRHEVTTYLGASPEGIIKDLSNVPKPAKLLECTCEGCADDGRTIKMVFEIETECPGAEGER